MIAEILTALSLQAGYNAALVTVGAALLGTAAGIGGAFVFLRKRALVSDAIAHATLPGVGLAFILMVLLGGDGRNLAGLMVGSALSAGAGLLAVGWLTARTRLGEDTAIGAVLSAFFGLGIVLLTVIQTMDSGRQAGLESVLLGSTAGMLFSDAVMIALGGALTLALVLALRRPMLLVAFDPGYAEATGVPVRRVDLAMMGIVLAVTVVGLKLVGLILVVALLIIPPVAARFWTDRTDRLVLIAGLFGGACGWIGAAVSASAPDLPTGPIIVLVGFSGFLLSLAAAPKRGVLAGILRHRSARTRILRRQGLVAIGRGRPVEDRAARVILLRDGLIAPDGRPTAAGREAAAAVLQDEMRWTILAEGGVDGGPSYDGVTPLDGLVTAAAIRDIDRRIARGRTAGGSA